MLHKTIVNNKLRTTINYNPVFRGFYVSKQNNRTWQYNSSHPCDTALGRFHFPVWATHNANHTQGGGNSPTTLTTLGCTNEGEVARIVGGQWVCTVVVGPQGDTGPQGEIGPQGPVGADGADGVDGTNGTDASLPVGVDPGDILYWDGVAWQLTPAPTPGCGDPVLTLKNNVPTWTYDRDVYCIGDTGPAGGIVFYVTDDGLHGLEVAPAHPTNHPWGCISTAIVDAVDGTLAADSTEIETGQQNSHDILMECESDEVTAAEVAIYYNFNVNPGWYLPSLDELNELYIHRATAGIFEQVLWTSTQIDAETAWAQQFTDGLQVPLLKNVETNVRFIRQF